jgi:elongation factor 1-gamma
VPKEKKAEHPFKIMDREKPSPFVMDTWKKTYSNCETYEAAMATFWETFDNEGWSIFRGDYNYNDELKVLFMTSNLIGGFIQRTEEIRKWLFGTMTIRGVEGEQMKVTAYYLIRGDSIQPLISCNDDAACYTWTKMAVPASEADKKSLFEHWCSEGPLDGEPCLDSRAYK